MLHLTVLRGLGSYPIGRVKKSMFMYTSLARCDKSKLCLRGPGRVSLAEWVLRGAASPLNGLSQSLAAFAKHLIHQGAKFR